MTDTVKIPLLAREADPRTVEVRADAQFTRITFPLSSETPVDRVFGNEILVHEPGAVRMDRAERQAMPLLFNHDWNDPVGMVDSAKLRDGRLVVDAHFFDTDRAQQVAAMVRGGLKNVSVGYRIYDGVEDRKAGEVRVTDWEPYEASIVTVPADPTVGIGRASGLEFEARIHRTQITPVINVDCGVNREEILVGIKTAMEANNRALVAELNSASAAVSSANTQERIAMSDENKAAAGQSADEKGDALRAAQEKLAQSSAVELEAGRVRAIENLAKANKIPENVRDAWVRQGYSLEQVSNDILNILEQRGKSNPQPATLLGLTGAETQRFSIARAIEAAASGKWEKAGFELEASRAVAQKLGKVADEKRFFVPFEVQARPIASDVVRYLESIGRRDLTAASAGAGGYLVATENQGFIEILRNRSVAFRMGARRLSGLQGSVTVPRQSAAATAVWLANEASTVTESQQTFVQMALSPKSVGAYTEISRQLLLQSSPAAEGIVNDDLAQVVALAADLGVLEGSGASGQPTGISNTGGIGSVTGTSLAAAGVIEFQTDVASSNVSPVRGGYVTTPAVAGLLMARPELPSTGTERLWKGNIWDGSLFDFPAMTSNQLTAATMIFGDWQEVVVGEWGVLEVEVNPYANFQAGIIGVRAIYSLDVGVRRPFAFSRATTIT